MISRLDRDIGKVLAALDGRGLSGNTLVIFTSDNGPGSEGGADLAFFESAGGLRGEKRDLYEGGIRVPMIARWPDRVGANRTSAHVSAFWDVMPTFGELAGVPVPRTDGISFVPELLGQKQSAHDHLYWEFHEGGKRAQAVLLGSYKVIRQWSPGARGRQAFEVFDLAADPSETTDISASRPDLVARALKVMDSRTPSPIGKFNFEAGD